MDTENQAQQDALDKAHQILGEHFDSSLILTRTATESDGQDLYNSIYRGGMANAVGMAELFVFKVKAGHAGLAPTNHPDPD